MEKKKTNNNKNNAKRLNRDCSLSCSVCSIEKDTEPERKRQQNKRQLVQIAFNIISTELIWVQIHLATSNENPYMTNDHLTDVNIWFTSFLPTEWYMCVRCVSVHLAKSTQPIVQFVLPKWKSWFAHFNCTCEHVRVCCCLVLFFSLPFVWVVFNISYLIAKFKSLVFSFSFSGSWNDA